MGTKIGYEEMSTAEIYLCVPPPAWMLFGVSWFQGGIMQGVMK
jgi:hypothetical protein